MANNFSRWGGALQPALRYLVSPWGCLGADRRVKGLIEDVCVDIQSRLFAVEVSLNVTL